MTRLSTAAAALCALPFLAGPGFSQETPETAETQQQAPGDAAPEEQAQDQLVATVGDAEIRGRDVMAVIQRMPPQMRSQSPDMLVPMALGQLVMRELILQKAQTEGLAGDPDVTALLEASPQADEDDAMVQVWLQRRFEGVVTDEAVQGLYDEAGQSSPDPLPPLDQVRPQIEQRLQQQELNRVRSELAADAEIVFYGPDGEPVEPQAAGEAAPEEAAPEAEADDDAPDAAGSQDEAETDDEAAEEGGEKPAD